MPPSEVYGVGPEAPGRACPGGRQCICPPEPATTGQGCCLLNFPHDPCDDCPAAHPELEQHCADCGIGETEEALIVRSRHGGDVLLCEECDRDARALVPEEYRDGR